MIKTLRSFLFGLIWLCAVNALAGSISFQQPVSLSTGVSPRGLVLGRFTGTSAQFLAVANFGSSTFIGQSTPLSIISKQTSTVQVFSPSPIGLTPFAQIPVGRSPRGLAVVPDTSGNDNLLVSCYDSALLQMYRWNGSQFLKMDESPTLFQPVGVCYGITKAGGVPFVVVANYGANQISIYEIKNGKFGIRYDITVPAGPTQVAVGDLHGDGINEIVVACLGTGQLAILSPAATSPNDLSTFTVRQTLSPAPGADLSDLRIVDLNHDGRSDLVASDFAKSIIWIYLQQKDGTLVLQPPLTTNGSHPNGLTVADLDKTGFPVIIVADRDSDLVDLYQWNGINCQPLQSLKIASDLDSNFGPVEVAALDTTGSGLLDLVTTHMRSNSIKILSQVVEATTSPTPLPDSIAVNAFTEKNTYFYPNPFRDGHLTLSWDLPSPQTVELRIFDLTGTLIYSQSIGKGQTHAGINQITWNGTNLRGERLASGLYIYKITVGNQTITKKLAIIR